MRNFNLTIEPNQSVAIVGHSGSGKSTIASLILRFYDSVKGQIVIDGHELKKISVPYLRDQISIVQQEPLLFNETIKQNILFGNLNASDPEIRTVAASANAMGFIMQNDDDLSSMEVKTRMREVLAQVLHEAIGDSTEFPNLSSIPKKLLSSHITFKDVSMINLVVPNLSATGLRRIEDSFEAFLEAIRVKSLQSDVTW